MRIESPIRVEDSHQAGGAATPLLLLGVLILAVIVFVIQSNQKASVGPVPVIWDKTACAYCAMHLGDPRFAAQLSTENGVTYFYDDPGCLFLHQADLAAINTPIHAQWFRQWNGENWISGKDVAFQRCKETPMDFGFGAIHQGDPLAISLKEAAAEVLAL